MSIPVLIIGKSGTGKSTSLRNLDPDDCILIQALKKPLPFKNKWKPWDGEKKSGSVFVSDKAKTIIACIKKAKENKKSIVIIDDFQYQMGNQFMRKANEKGYQKFTDIAKDAWDIVQAVIESDDDLRVYILGHSYEDDLGENIRMKTIGKMLDDKITMEGMFSIVFRSILNDGEYFFRTKNSGCDTVKTPMGMFKKEEIPNDLAEIDAAICSYYEIGDNSKMYEKAMQLHSMVDDEDGIILKTIEKFKNNPKKLKTVINKINNIINGD